MKRWALAAIAGLLGLVWLSACGPKGASGTEVRVRLVSPLDGSSPATATVVYQVGDGNWQLALKKGYGVYAFTIPSNEKRYGVAVNCIPAAMTLRTTGYAYVYQLTTDDTKELKVACLNLSDFAVTDAEKVEATKASGETGYNKVWFHTAWSHDQKLLDTPTKLRFTAKANRDLIVVAYSDGSVKYTPDNIRRILFERNFDASTPPVCPSTSPCTYTLPTNDPDTASVYRFSLPSWANRNPWFGVGFVSRKGAVVYHGSRSASENPALGTGDSSGGTYYLIPGTEPGDVYYAEASADDGTGKYRAGEVRVLDHNGGMIVFSLPTERFEPNAERKALTVFENLSYSDDALIGYAFEVAVGYMDGTDFKPTFYELTIVSKDWLDSATSYTLPDLSGAPDFHGSKPLSGDTVGWQAMAIMANKSIGEILSGDPLPLPNPLPRIPGLSLRMASKRGQYTVP